jgi:hypothetical protein
MPLVHAPIPPAICTTPCMPVAGAALSGDLKMYTLLKLRRFVKLCCTAAKLGSFGSDLVMCPTRRATGLQGELVCQSPTSDTQAT